jgi:hypothetical protein
LNVERLSQFMEAPTLHRAVLRGYDGPYALGVTMLPDRNGALLLRVPTTETSAFPSLVDVGGEPVVLIVHGGWKPPVPL